MGFQQSFKALSDPVRREILSLLRRGPMAAGDIAAQMGAEPLGQAGWTDEEIVDANPEAIFAVHVSSVSDEEAIALYTENPALASVDAVKNGRIYPVEYSLAYAPGVRTKDTVKLFLKSLYGIEA